MRKVNVDIFYRYVDWLAAKNIVGGYLPPDTFNMALPICVNQIVRKYYGVPEQYQPGMPMPQVSYEITQLVTDYMSQLKVPKILPVDNSGYAAKPADYLHKSSVACSFVTISDNSEDDGVDEADCCDDEPTKQTTKKKAQKAATTVYAKWIPVTVVTDNERWAYLQSTLRKPTKRFPICTFIGDGLQFYPENIKTALLTYIRYPKTPVWAYTIAPDGFPTYNPVTSEDIELPEIVCDELAATLLNRMGISIREPGLVDWANYVKKTGV